MALNISYLTPYILESMFFILVYCRFIINLSSSTKSTLNTSSDLLSIDICLSMRIAEFFTQLGEEASEGGSRRLARDRGWKIGVFMPESSIREEFW